jgi:hypothetical protein
MAVLVIGFVGLVALAGLRLRECRHQVCALRDEPNDMVPTDKLLLIDVGASFAEVF